MWQRLDDSDASEQAEGVVRVARAYGWQGRRYPRVMISIYYWYDGGLKIGISAKDSAKSWWEDCGLPVELTLELVELLEEAKGKGWNESSIKRPESWHMVHEEGEL